MNGKMYFGSAAALITFGHGVELNVLGHPGWFLYVAIGASAILLIGLTYRTK